MANFIKSHSNYVLKKKHQDINSGTIFERDITTIGGLDQFSKGRTPIYKSSNFIITVNNEVSPSREMTSSNWFTSPSGDEIWTIEDVNMVSSNKKESSEVVLKQDYYSLKDFAYYGSCSELIRASVNNIALNFPGSLYVPKGYDGNGIPVYYETTEQGKGVVEKRLGDDKNLILVSNPSNINAHTKQMNDKDITNPLKFMCNCGIDNYRNDSKEFSGCTDWKVTEEEGCEINGKKVFKKGDLMATITIGDITLYAYKGELDTVIYLTTKGNVGKLIAKPKEEHFTKFYNSLDYFERVIFNHKSNPKYSALFEVISENSFGYETSLRKFTFPTIDDGNNISTTDGNFAEYVNSLLQYAELYDEIFSDNLWRSMTHESIKNFDWSYTREYSDTDDDDYILGGNKIQKLIRLFGRQFDEIKLHIDGISGYNQIAYGNKNLLPDYYLTDVLNDEEGWDVVNIFPFSKESGKLSQMSELSGISPYSVSYSCYDYGYFNNNGNIECANENELYRVVTADCATYLVSRTKTYNNEREYSLDEVNNEFLKRLILNSRNIWRKKGTIEGIESLLALFGLRSDRMTKSVECDGCGQKKVDGKYDYEIKEYTTKVCKDFEDGFESKYSMHKYNYFNSTKTVAYNTDDYRQGIYHSYQGLPVRSYIKKEVNRNTLYYRTDSLPIDVDLNEEQNIYLLPYFSKNKIIDGNPYYQMNGGWLFKNHYLKDNEGNDYEISAYTETYRDIKTVENLKELVSLPMQNLRNNSIYKVNDLSLKIALVDGLIYDVYTDENGNDYIRTYIVNNSTKVGMKYFADELSVSDKDGNVIKYVFSQYPNNSEIRIYLYGDEKTIFAYGKYYSIGKFMLFNPNDNEKTNYFVLRNVDNKLKIDASGWYQLSVDDNKYKILTTIQDYFKGNNPHSGHLAYDGGYEYISYFKQLFKYAIENEEFDYRCYDNIQTELYDVIKDFGFDFMSCKDNDGNVDDENADDECYYPIYENNSLKYSSGKQYSDINKIVSNFKKIIKTSDSENFINNEYNSDFIINTKRVKIKFNLTYEELSTKGKFYDYVIMNYLSQLIPSTLIVEVEYFGNGNIPEQDDEDIEDVVEEYKFGDITANGLGACDTTISVNVKDLSSGQLLPSSNYTVTPSTIEQNDTTSPKTISVTINGKGNYAGQTKTLQITQAAGPCVPEETCTEKNKWESLTVSGTKMGKCDETSTLTVKASGTHTNSDCTTESTSTTLSASDYSVTYSPKGENNTPDERTVTIKVSGKGEYASLTASTTVKQDEGPCKETCTEDYEYSDATLSFDADDMGKCESATTISNVKLEGVKKINEDCTTSSTSTTLGASDYTVTYDPSGVNNTTSERTVKVTLTTSSEYGNISKTVEVKQEKGKCEEDPTCTVSNSWSSMSVSGTSMGKCETTSTLTVKASGTHTNSDCTTSTTSTTLGASDYTVTYTPSGENTTSSERTITIEVKGKGDYNGLSASTTVTQAEGPCEDVYVFEDNNTPQSNLEHGYGTGSTSVHVISTKNGNMFSSITVTASCDWLTFDEIFSSGNDYYVIPYSISENTNSTERTCTITATQGESNYTEEWTVTQEGKPVPSCNCNQVQISCSPTSIDIDYNKQTGETTVTVTSTDNNCSTNWLAYSEDGAYLTSGHTGDKFDYILSYEYQRIIFKSESCSDVSCNLDVKMMIINNINIYNNLPGEVKVEYVEGSAVVDEWTIGPRSGYNVPITASSRTEIRIIGTSTAVLNNGSLCNSCHIAVKPDGSNIQHLVNIDTSSTSYSFEEDSVWIIPQSTSGLSGLVSYANGRYYIEVNFRQ